MAVPLQDPSHFKPLPFVSDASNSKHGWIFDSYFDTQAMQLTFVIIYTDGTIATQTSPNQLTVLS